MPPTAPVRQRRFASLFVALVAAIALAPHALAWLQPSATSVLSGVAPVQVPPLPDTPAADAPGLILTLTKGDNAEQEPPDVRTARLVALNVPAGQPASPFVAPGSFKATWTGDINLRIRGEYTFSARGNGTIKASVNDEPALDAVVDETGTNAGQPVKLKKGKNRLVVEYASPPQGDAVVRLYWSAREFPPEPVPPTLLTHPAADAALRAHARVRHGRELIASHRCLQCHAPEGADAESIATAGGMPELAMDAPDLTEAGARLNAPWMAQWIANPKSLRPDATMPALFHGDGAGAPQEATHIAAYLSTLGAADAASVAIEESAAAAGGRLFTGLGCIACHVPPDHDPSGAAAVASATAPYRVPLRHVSTKYKPAALTAFLLAPEKHYAWTRMPNFRLSEEEATQLSAFLRSRAPADAIRADAAAGGDAARGKALFASSGCLNCHTGPSDVQNTSGPPGLTALKSSDWTRGCLAADATRRGSAPAFGFTEDHRASLATFAAADWSNLTRDHAADFSQRQYAILNCVACHTRDKQQDVWTSLKSEIDALEATLPDVPEEEEDQDQYAPDQSRPTLTWAGEKLKPEWAAKFIAGQVPYKPRPWLRARMPGFPAPAKRLARGMAMEHGFAATTPPEPAPVAELAEIGQQLSGRDGGFSCNQCHAVGDAPPFAAFEAPAPNFAHAAERLRKHYYDRWMFNPQRVEPGTRMPQFTDRDGMTALKDHFDGDARKQFDAIWHYLLERENIRPAE